MRRLNFLRKRGRISRLLASSPAYLTDSSDAIRGHPAAVHRLRLITQPTSAAHPMKSTTRAKLENFGVELKLLRAAASEYTANMVAQTLILLG